MLLLIMTCGVISFSSHHGGVSDTYVCDSRATKAERDAAVQWENSGRRQER